MTTLAQTSFPSDFGSLSKKKIRPTPEPASWGAIMVGVALAVFVYIRFIRPRNRCTCGHRHP